VSLAVKLVGKPDAECGPGSYVALAGMGLTGVVQEIFSAT
jgi:hypothetical protein